MAKATFPLWARILQGLRLNREAWRVKSKLNIRKVATEFPPEDRIGVIKLNFAYVLGFHPPAPYADDKLRMHPPVFA
jgi:hypothetical protein